MFAALLLSAPAAGALEVYAAGDIAQCKGSAAASAAAKTARLIPPGSPVLLLGDSTYPDASQALIERCYAPTWGRFRATTLAVAGNHDYVQGSAEDFLRYFGGRAGPRTWFREALGDWWVIGLDSNIGDEELAVQQAWLENELAAIAGDGRCIVAMWHHALFSTGLHQGDGARMATAWRALDAAGADLVLSGHEHFYESFDPLDAEGKRVPVGIREFVVGTGGANLVDFSLSTKHRAYARVYGVLQLELLADRYTYRFKTVGGGSRDHGGASCRRAHRDAPAP